MASTLIQAADAMVTALAAATVPDELPRSIIASRMLVARFEMETLEADGSPRVTVVPTGMKVHRDEGQRRGTRRSMQWLYSFDVAIHRKIDDTADAEGCVDLYERVNDFFALKRLPGMLALSWHDSVEQTVYDTGKLDSNDVYLGVQTVTFTGRR